MAVETIKGKIEEIQKAKRSVADGKLTLWNARLDALISAGDSRGVIEALAAGDDINNCGCNVQCGARGGAEGIISR